MEFLCIKEPKKGVFYSGRLYAAKNVKGTSAQVIDERGHWITFGNYKKYFNEIPSKLS